MFGNKLPGLLDSFIDEWPNNMKWGRGIDYITQSKRSMYFNHFFLTKPMVQTNIPLRRVLKESHHLVDRKNVSLWGNTNKSQPFSPCIIQTSHWTKGILFSQPYLNQKMIVESVPTIWIESCRRANKKHDKRERLDEFLKLQSAFLPK